MNRSAKVDLSALGFQEIRSFPSPNPLPGLTNADASRWGVGPYPLLKPGPQRQKRRVPVLPSQRHHRRLKACRAGLAMTPHGEHAKEATRTRTLRLEKNVRPLLQGPGAGPGVGARKKSQTREDRRWARQDISGAPLRIPRAAKYVLKKKVPRTLTRLYYAEAPYQHNKRIHHPGERQTQQLSYWEL